MDSLHGHDRRAKQSTDWDLVLCSAEPSLSSAHAAGAEAGPGAVM